MSAVIGRPSPDFLPNLFLSLLGMAIEEGSRRRKHSGKRTHRHKDAARTKAPVDDPDTVSVLPDNKPCDVDELRQARLTYHEKSPEERRKLRMKFIGESTRTAPPVKVEPQYSRRVKRRQDVDSNPGKRRRSKSRGAKSNDTLSDFVYVRKDDYKRCEEARGSSIRDKCLETVVEETSEAGSSDGQRSLKRKARDDEVPRRTVRTEKRIEDRDHRASRRETGSLLWLGVPRQSSPRREHDQDRLRRASSTRESISSPRSNLHRSSTAVHIRSEPTKRSTPKRVNTAPSVMSRDEKKAPSVISTFLKGSSPKTTISEKSCLKRVFTMSLTDPAHMPPKCCTDNHIPLKHVDKLFDQKFKVKWNKKFQEYSTRNRLYCPSKGCGEWIKPSHISIEQGRKVGKCKRCGTKVCATCNNRMHTSRECPKDEATNQFVEVAKKEGWQRCYNCKAMVELKEGCNHMTCRCTAQFCMICGNKWKTCDCPWFNYEAVEADRLQHMNVPEPLRYMVNPDRRAPIRYQEEMDRRREQEVRDEALARRLEALGVDNDSQELPHRHDQINVFGIGNAAGHFMGQNFQQQPREMLAGNFHHLARAAEGLFNGEVTGRENPLPPALFEFNPIRNENAADQTARLLRQHGSRNRQHVNPPALQANELVAPRERPFEQVAGLVRHMSAGRVMSNPGPTRRESTRRSSDRNSSAIPQRRQSAMAELVEADREASGGMPSGQSSQRIANWVRDVPVGHPGPGPHEA
ncbi:MAG: hypothetical protein Q9227_005491 [Pyrenula ochraceoflavens]